MKLNKANMLDAVVALAVLLVVGSVGIYSLRKPVAETTRVKVTVAIADRAQVSAVSQQATSEKSVYFDSVNMPVSVTNVNSQEEGLEITLVGPGHAVADNYFVFNGQRILIGQKAEIHAGYFAQGKIIKIENAN